MSEELFDPIEPAGKGRPVLWIAAGAVVLVGALLLLGGWYGPDANAPVLTEPARVRDLRVTVRAVGTIDAARSTVVSSKVRGDRGKIIWIVEDGVRVDEGDLLVRLDPTPFEEEVAELVSDIEELTAKLEEQRQNLEWEKLQADREEKTAEFDLNTAELSLTQLELGDGPLELARLEGSALKAKEEYEEKKGYIEDLEQLHKQGLVNPAEIAQARRTAEETERVYDVARRQFESYRDYVLPSLLESARAKKARAAMNLEQTTKAGKIRVKRAEAELARAERELEASRERLEVAKAELGMTGIEAPIPGMVVLQPDYRGGEKRKPRVGDAVLQNRPLVYLPDVTSFIVETRVREVDLHKVQEGKKARIQVDAYPAKEFTGQVESIGVMAEASGGRAGEKHFPLRIAIDQADDRLRPGMTARVEIMSADVSDALTVPIHAVHLDDGQMPFVYVKKGRSFHEQPVELGEANEYFVEVLGGLTEGEKVALSPPPDEQIFDVSSP